MENKSAYVFDHVNVYRSCISLLDLRGWKIKIIPGPYEEGDSLLDTYEATRDNTRILAEDPLRLLGLANLHEYHHPHEGESYWWTVESEDIGLHDRLEDEALEEAFFDFQKRNPEAWEITIKFSVRGGH